TKGEGLTREVRERDNENQVSAPTEFKENGKPRKSVFDDQIHEFNLSFSPISVSTDIADEAIAGPWICILGAVYLEKPVIGPLTDFILMMNMMKGWKSLLHFLKLYDLHIKP
ncbi:86_t:CDS:2, partial [Funneliformis mosseae]